MEKVIEIKNETGLHARPAALFVREATKFNSDITIAAGGKKGNAKSVMSVMSMGITKNTEITLTATGDDEQNALEALEAFIIDQK
ncbi:MAG: HPr family phosphocarrier protein [Bacteriovoracaceae bacterium]|jgi:phosphotransferase system HPr (HPr) family protein|nr:HPr family phosphocarrier protein [Bacteriovoracaceae bacterium]